MNLQLIIGGSGMGKSTYVYEEIIKQSMDNPNKNYIVLVPEQYTMETQKKLVQMHPNHGILNIDILSFQRLSYKIIEEIGGSLGEMLDDTGKNLIIRKCIDDHKKELKVLAGASNKIDFVPQVKASISEYMQYDISVEKAYEMAGSVDNPQLAAKLNDIAIIYDSFKQYIEEKFLTTEELFTYVSKRIGEATMLSNCTIAMDGFTGFTPVQYRLITALYQKAEKLMVTVPIDSEEKYNVLDGISNLFYIGKDTVASLYRMADECHGNIEAPVLLGDINRSRFANNRALYFLGKNLFATNKRVYADDTDSIVTISAPDPMTEVKFVASEILRLTRGKNSLRYRDIAVIAGNVADYGKYADKIFRQNNIPVFVDEKISLIKHGVVDLIRGAIDVLVDNYSFDSMMRFAKNPLLSLDQNLVNILENYCLATGVRGRKKWEQEFSRRYANRNAYKVNYGALNSIRQQLMELLSPLETGLKRKDSTAKDMVAAVREFLSNAKLEETIALESKKAAEEGDFALASFYDQLMDKLNSLFTQIEELLKDEEFNHKEFAKLLDAGFSELQIGVIPPGMDYVMVGDMTRTRIDNKKVVFCLGLNEGKVLNGSSSKNLIGNDDKNTLKGIGVKLSPDDTEKTYTQRLYLYMNMTKPSMRLYLSYSSSDWNGQGLIRSHLITAINKIFPKIGTINLKNEAGSLFRGLHMAQASISWESADLDATLDEGTAKKLYGEIIKASITRMEKYAKCAFMHFVEYGLELSEREQFQVDARIIGNTLHEAVEKIVRRMQEEKVDYQTLTKEDLHNIVEAGMGELERELSDTAYLDNSRNRELFNRVKGIADKSIWALTSQLRAGDFVPYSLELPVEMEIDEGVVYRGKIDRVDICEKEDAVYVKIIDYKSGKEALSWTEIYNGLKLQLFTYMKVAKAGLEQRFPGKKIIPAAAFYYHMDDPIVDFEEGSEITDEMAQTALLEALMPGGVVAYNPEVAGALDRVTANRGGKSLVAPVEFSTKTNPPTLTEKDLTLSDREFEQIIEFVGRKLEENTRAAVSGKVAINPIATSSGTSCDYCDYRSICGFDREIYSDRMVKLATKKKEDIIAYMNLHKNDGEDNKNVD